MSETISDGTGSTCASAKVDTKNRLHVGSVSRTERDAAIADGRYYIASSGVVTLTDAVDTPVIYFENLSDDNVYLDVVLSSSGNSTGGTGNAYLRSWGNISDTSTIVSNAVPAFIGNSNLSSQNTFDGNVYSGVSGDTIVGGGNFNTFIFDTPNYLETGIVAVLPKGSNGMFSVQAPTDNTDLEVIVNVLMYYLDTELPS